MQAAHELDVERLKAVPVGRDEVEAAVHALVGLHLAVHLRLGVQVLVILGLDVLDDWLPTVNRQSGDMWLSSADYFIIFKHNFTTRELSSYYIE